MSSPQYSQVIENMLNIVNTGIAAGISDIHFKTDMQPAFRVNGFIKQSGYPAVTNSQIVEFILFTAPKSNINTENFALTYDYSWDYEKYRFRCNAFHDLSGWSLSMRLLNIQTIDFQTLRIPEILKKLVNHKSGLILITGPTGSGKTTTLTCLIDYINSNYKNHIIMIEDPVEYVHKSRNSIISQREIGRDTLSFGDAVIEALREDPDIILIGEMRDKESISAALRAAETGHLVLSTLHTKGAANTITRIIDVYPPEQKDQIILQLSMSITAVISQQLIPRTDGFGRVLATEVMTGSYAVRSLIRQQKFHMITSTLQTSSNEGMYSMRQSLEELRDANLITKDDYDNYQIH